MTDFTISYRRQEILICGPRRNGSSTSETVRLDPSHCATVFSTVATSCHVSIDCTGTVHFSTYTFQNDSSRKKRSTKRSRYRVLWKHPLLFRKPQVDSIWTPIICCISWRKLLKVKKRLHQKMTIEKGERAKTKDWENVAGLPDRSWIILYIFN